MNFSSGIIAIVLFLGTSCIASASDWDRWVSEKGSSDTTPVVVSREIKKSNRIQIIGPTLGYMDRKDFYSHTVVSLGVRYFLSESHAWEMLRVQYDSAGLSNSASDVIAQTGYHLDAKQAPWSISTGYVYSLAYGKYALSENSLIHFDAYLGASLGTRFTPEEVQIFFEPYLGVTHYLNPNLGLVLPEIRTRFYSERRGNGSGSNVLVGELICLAGVTWLF